MPKGQSLKFEGVLCNAPIEAMNGSSLLPKQEDSKAVFQRYF